MQINQISGINFNLDLSLFHQYIPHLSMYDHMVDIIHIYTTITAMSLQSLFAICVSSCHATASISRSCNLSISHVVNTTQESFSLHHVAKAFILESWIIPILGVFIHCDMHRFSTMLYILGLSFLDNSLAPV